MRRLLAVGLCLASLVAACSSSEDGSSEGKAAGDSAVASGGSFGGSSGGSEEEASVVGSTSRVTRLEGLPDFKARQLWGADYIEVFDAGFDSGPLEPAQEKAAEFNFPLEDHRALEAVSPAGWMAFAVNLGKTSTLSPPRQARALAAVAVAMNGAVIGTINASEKFDPSPLVDDASADQSRLAPQLAAPVASEYSARGLPIATSVAAAEVLEYLFPSHKARIEAALGSSKAIELLSGRVSVYSASVASVYGSLYGSIVVRRLQEEGIEFEPRGDYVVSPGATWVPTPPLFSPALDPIAGDWPKWNTYDEALARIPAPPASDSPELEAAAQQVYQVTLAADDTWRRLIDQWALVVGTETPPGIWMLTAAQYMIDQQVDVSDQAYVLAVLATAMADTGVEVWHEKFRYGLLRPITVIRRDIDPNFSSLVVTPPFPSYPSGHSTFSGCAAEVLGGVWPDLAARWADSAGQAGDSRVVGGIHYWFDNSEGLKMGERLCGAIADSAGLKASTDSALAHAHYVSLDAGSPQGE